MSDNKWDEKLTEKFLTLYRKHKCLWNPYSPDYKNCSAKNTAFEIVVEELNAPGIRIEECLQQIEVIRERYREEQRRVKSGLKSGMLYNSKVPWFNHMSKMLCEVIRDEEKFDKNCQLRSPVQNSVSTDKGKRDDKSENSYYASSVLSKEDCKNSADLKKRSTKIDEADCIRCDKCSSNGCSWGKGKEEEEGERVYGRKKIRFVSCEGSGVEIEPGIELENLIDRSLTPSSLRSNDQQMNNQSNRNTIKATEEFKDVTESERKATGEGKCVSTEEKENEITGSCVDCSLEIMNKINEMEKNPAKSAHHKCCQSRMENLGKTNRQIDEPPASKILQLYRQDTLNWGSENDKLPAEARGKLVERRMNGCVSPNCVEHSSRDSYSKFSPESDEERYDVCTRFKIVIPGPASEDKNLEITGYEVRSTNPRLRSNKYTPQCDKNPAKQISSSDSYCICSRKELSFPTKRDVVNIQDAEGFGGSIIKLDINYNCSEDGQRRQSKTHNEARVNKKTQTERSYGHEVMRRKEAESNSCIVFFRDQESSTDDASSTNRTARYSNNVFRDIETSVKSRNEGRATGNQSCCTEQKENRTKTSGSLILEEGERFNNTKMVLNVIVKILEGDKTQDEISNRELERTLNTMLETFHQRMSIGGSKSVIEPPKNEFTSSFETTQYKNLPRILRREDKTDVDNTPNSQKSIDTSKTSEPTNSSPYSAQMVFDEYNDKIPAGDETSMLLLPGERSDAASGGVVRFDRAGGQLQTPKVQTNGLQDESTVDDEEIIIAKSRPQVAATPDDVIKMPRFSSDPTLNYTVSDFMSEEPVASSSRRNIEEPRPANQLAKDFLEIIKYTIMMDQVLEASENNGNDCCNKLPNQSR